MRYMFENDIIDDNSIINIGKNLHRKCKIPSDILNEILQNGSISFESDSEPSGERLPYYAPYSTTKEQKEEDILEAVKKPIRTKIKVLLHNGLMFNRALKTVIFPDYTKEKCLRAKEKDLTNRVQKMQQIFKYRNNKIAVAD